RPTMQTSEVLRTTGRMVADRSLAEAVNALARNIGARVLSALRALSAFYVEMRRIQAQCEHEYGRMPWIE
ncbi:MAG TPA: hypothetical protein VMV45_05945, partial [Casimicrobiaceae bacterium]|nr:hypothetical protein [Casimicrobiaceae bacterium]